jgi:hypothetical protein
MAEGWQLIMSTTEALGNWKPSKRGTTEVIVISRPFSREAYPEVGDRSKYEDDARNVMKVLYDSLPSGTWQHLLKLMAEMNTE